MPFRREIDTKATGSTSGSREVNNLLHTLRGEQFRHSQNLRRSKAHLASAVAHSYNDPSLPFSEFYRFTHGLRRNTARDAGGAAVPPPVPVPVIRDGHLEHDFPRGPVPGPPPPRSWGGLFGPEPGHEAILAAYDPVLDKSMPAFRRRALSLVLSHASWSFGSSDVPIFESSPYADLDVSDSPVPPLARICLRVLLAEFPDTAGFRDELLPAIPPYFRRDILRYTAVHDPLPNAKLLPLLEPDGHTDGELIVVGPQATLQRDHLLSLSPSTPTRRATSEEELLEDRGEGSSTSRSPTEPTNHGEVPSDADEDSWDTESSSQEQPPLLQTLIVLNAPVPTATLFAFPLVLTRLALLALPSPTPVHRLPRICPLLEVLDLSYNPWLNEPPGGQGTVAAETIVQRIEWDKWARLRVLGLRGCRVPQNVIARVNKGRWEDVEVVVEEHRTFRTSMGDVEAMMKGLRLTD